MATVRELIATLGFEVDTTPIKQFNAAIRQARNGVKALNAPVKQFNKTINQTKRNIKGLRTSVNQFKTGVNQARIGISKFKTGVKQLGSSIKKVKLGISDKLKKSAKGINSSGVRDEFSKELKKLGKFAKKTAIAAFAGIGAAAAASLKFFKSFATEEQALTRLRFQFEDTFTSTVDNIDKTIKNTDNLVKRIDVLNAAAASFEIDTNPEAFNASLDSAIKFSRILGKDVTDISQLFAQFRAFGDVEGLKALGLFTSQQLEVLKKAGTEVTQVGQIQRTKELDRLLNVIAPRLNKSFDEFKNTSTATVDALAASSDKAAKALGETLAPTINAISNSIRTDVDAFTETLRQTGSIWKALVAFDSRISQIGGPPSLAAPSIPTIQATDQPITIENNITVNGQADEATLNELKRIMTDTMSQSAGTIVQQNRRTTIIRGQNQE